MTYATPKDIGLPLLKALGIDSRAQTEKVRPSIRTVTTDLGLKVPAALAEFIGAVPREKGFR